MAFNNQLPVQGFPGFTHYGVVAPQVKEIATSFNAESLDALSSMAEEHVAWADVGSGVTPGMFEVKIPIRLPSSMSFQPFDGSRSYNKLDIAAPAVRVNPFDLNFEWPMVIDQSGNVQLKDFYGASGLAQEIVDAARAYKAQLVASLMYEGFTNAALGVTAKALTIPQPGLVNGLPLYTDGSATAQHYAHPFRSDSPRFKNLYLGAGKFTQDTLAQSLLDMTQVPHPTLPNMPLGCKVTDVVGPTHMLLPFWKAAIQTLSLETTTSPGNLAAATTNPYSAEALERAGVAGFTGATGLAPWRFWIAPQLDNHPYIAANPTSHMWVTICSATKTGKRQKWAELAAPTKEFTPVVTLFGDNDPESRRLRMVRMISDLDAGVAAGLPHFTKMYFETTPS